MHWRMPCWHRELDDKKKLLFLQTGFFFAFFSQVCYDKEKWKRRATVMEKNEILVIYGTDYIGMTKEILEEADLAGQIGDRKKRDRKSVV